MEYLQNLKTRRKWQHDRPNIKDGDLVLMKETDYVRNEWPLGLVVNAIKELITVLGKWSSVS